MGLIETPSALLRLMIGGPELSRMISEFEGGVSLSARIERHHHEELHSIQRTFAKK